MTVVQIVTCVMIRCVEAVTRYRMASEPVTGCPMRVRSMCIKAMKTRCMTKVKCVRATMSSKSVDATKRLMEPANPSTRMDAGK